MEGLLRTLVTKQHGPLVDETVRLYQAKYPNQTRAQAEALVFETICGLFCKAQNPELELSLPPALDEVWHMLLLQTREYAALCQDLGGSFVHHSTKTEQDALSVKNERCNRLIQVYCTAFGKSRDKQSLHWALEVEPPSTAANKRVRDELYESPLLIFKEINGATTSYEYVRSRRVSTYLAYFHAGSRLIFAGRTLDETRTMEENKVPPGATLHVVSNLRGC